jgi:histone H3/H4
MPKKNYLLKENTINHLIDSMTPLRVSSKSITAIQSNIDTITKKVLTTAIKTTKQDKRNTIMPRDITSAFKVILDKNLTSPKEITTSIKKLPLESLLELHKSLQTHIKQQTHK